MIKLFNQESEHAVIGAILLRPECLSEVRSELNPEDFGREEYRVIYHTFLDIVNQGKPLDVVILANELEKVGDLEKVGGKRYLFELADSVSTSAGIAYHVSEVKEARFRRNLIGLSDDIQNGLRDGMPVNDILSNLRNLILKMNAGSKSKIVSLKEALNRTIDHIETLSKTPNKLTGIPSGFIDIDRFTGGWQPGELTIVAGRPGMGKSILAKDLAEGAGVPIAYFTLEMSVEELTKRHLAGRGMVNLEALRTGRVTDEDWGKVIKAADSMNDVSIHYVDLGNMTIDDILATSENLKMTEDVGLVVIDYLQLIRPKERLEMREREVSEISRKLKGMARNLEIPVICLAQLNRQCEARENKRPRLSDLRESGSLEQDADIVGFLYREAAYDNQAPEHEAEFIIGKGRNIRVGTVKLYFDGEHQAFRNAIKDN